MAWQQEDTLLKIPPDREHVVTKAMIRAADRLGLSAKMLAGIIGLSEASVSRMRHGQLALRANDKSYELGVLLIRAYRSLDALVAGDGELAQRWLAAQNTALGARPLDLMQTVRGLVDVVAYLDARRAPL